MKIHLKLLACLLCCGHAAWSQNADATTRGKQATALVLVPGGSASAFCIAADGFFVTNDHVVGGIAAKDQVKLVLSPGETGEKIVSATVVRHDRINDLALLKASTGAPFAYLEIGSAATLKETQAVTAYGYPFGVLLAENGQYPSVSVTTGHITSLRKVRGELNLVQVDNSLNPGNSGGPVTDEKGKVVGIVEAGVFGAALNFAIPVSTLAAMLAKPDLAFDLEPLPYSTRYAPVNLTARVTDFGTKATNYAVDLELSGPAGTRQIELKGTHGLFTASASLLVSPGPEEYEVTVWYATGSLSGLIANRDFIVGGRTIPLGELVEVEGGNAPTATLRSGERLSGSIGRTTLQIEVGGASIPADTDGLRRLELSPQEPDSRPTTYVLTARLAGQEVATLSGMVVVSAPPESGQTAGHGTGVAEQIVGSGPIVGEPPFLGETLTLGLPAPVDEVLEAGGGRYLVMRIKQLMRIAVFDVAQGKVTKYLPLAEGDALIAGGMQKLVILLPGEHLIQRWNLQTFELEMSVPFTSTASSVAMGSASSGPLLIVSGRDPISYSLHSLRPIPLAISEAHFSPPGAELKAEATADGLSFVSWNPNPGETEVQRFDTRGNSIAKVSRSSQEAPFNPSPDGSLVFPRQGVLSAILEPIDPERFKGVICFPTASRTYFMGLVFPASAQRGPPRGAAVRTSPASQPQLRIYAISGRTLLATRDGFAELATIGDPFARNGGSVGFKQRFHFIPQFKTLVSLSQEGDSLVMRRFDLQAEMETSGIDYLYLSSAPVRQSVAMGARFAYDLAVESRRGGVKVTLADGPPGMTVSPVGQVRWRVPVGYSEKQVSVVLSIKDASGQEIFDTFTLTIE